MSELKPCPFCGSEVVRDRVNDPHYLDISCSECGESFRMNDEQWNRRAPSPVEAELRECLLLSDCALTGAYNGLITLGLSGDLPFMVEAREIMSNTRAMLAERDAGENTKEKT